MGPGAPQTLLWMQAHLLGNSKRGLGSHSGSQWPGPALLPSPTFSLTTGQRWVKSQALPC